MRLKLHMVNSLFSSSVANNCIRPATRQTFLRKATILTIRKSQSMNTINYTAIRAVNNYSIWSIKNTHLPALCHHCREPDNHCHPIKNCAGATLSDPTGCSSCGGGQVNQPPSVSITSPANNASFNAPATITINANASDPDGNVSKVEFYNGNTLLGTDNSSPYSYTWSNVAAGTYTITAKATDNKRKQTSSEITIILMIPLFSLTATSNTTQAADSINNPGVFTRRAATDAIIPLPGGLTTKNSSAKTHHLRYTDSNDLVSTVGGNSVWHWMLLLHSKFQFNSCRLASSVRTL